MAAYQAPPSLGFSRQEHRSGLPFPSPMHESEKWKWSHVQVVATSRTAAYQVPLSIGFSRQEYWSGLPLPSPIYIWENTEYIVLYFFFRIISGTFLYIFNCYLEHDSLMSKQNFYWWKQYYLFKHIPVVGHSRCFQYFSTINMNALIYKLFLWFKISRIEIMGSNSMKS